MGLSYRTGGNKGQCLKNLSNVLGTNSLFFNVSQNQCSFFFFHQLIYRGRLKEIPNLGFSLRLVCVSYNPLENSDSWGLQNSTDCSGCSSSTQWCWKLICKIHLGLAAAAPFFPLSPFFLPFSPFCPLCAFHSPISCCCFSYACLCLQKGFSTTEEQRFSWHSDIASLTPLMLSSLTHSLGAGALGQFSVFCSLCDVWAASGATKGEGETTQWC